MKKITFYLMMFLSFAAFSQVEIVENFDSTSPNQVPDGWTYTNNFRASNSFACVGNGNSASVGLPAGNSATLTTPNYTTVTNATDLTVSFSVNVFEQVSQFPPPSFVGPATGWGSLVLEYSIDGGSNWITAATVNDSNFTFSATDACIDMAPVNVGALAAGTDFQARFVATSVNVDNFATWITLDNVSITQVATTIPNCDATLISPANGSDTADTDVTLVWQAATGIPTGYNVSVGTTSGASDIVSDTTTDTNYALSGLTYETEYFVNIVPFNGFGNAESCTEESFTTRLAPIAGATCSSPHVVDMFPYIVASDDTANYENNVNSGSCGSNDTSYMLGNDVFYEIIPATDVSINIDLANISNNGAAMHLMKGCPTDVDKECIDYVGSFSTSGGSLNISEAVLLAGESYFLVLSNSSSSRTYSYSLIITQNSCINPDFLLTPVSDCGSGQFSVDVDVTYMGDASSLTLVDDFGNSNTNITTTGVVNFGPYPSGSTVNFTLTNNQDGNCSFEGSTYFYCPPSNDECANSIDLTSSINTDDTCTLFTNATNAGATESTGDPASCSGNTNDVWFSFVADGSTMILEYLNVTAEIGGGGTIQSTELMEGSCGSLTSLSCSTGQYVQLSNLIDGNTYYIRNKTNLSGEYAQSYDLCLRTAPTAPANDECSNATVLTLSTDDQCDNAASGTTSGATPSAENLCDSGTSNPYNDVWYAFTPSETGYYEFSWTNTGESTSTTRYAIFEGTCGTFTNLSSSCSTNNNQILNLTGSETYYVVVRTITSGPGVDFDLCVWQLPPAVGNSECSTPFVLSESPDQNGSNAISGNLDNSYNSPEGCSSASYESVWYSFTPTYTGLYNFDFTRVSGTSYYAIYNTDNCADTGSAGFLAGSCYGSSAVSADVVGGNTYLIMVHASSAAEFELFVYPDPSLSTESVAFETFKYYPNPIINTLTLEAKEAITKVTVHNIVGQQVEVLTPNNSKSTISMDGLKKGVYFVTVSINDAQKTIKVVKQ